MEHRILYLYLYTVHNTWSYLGIRKESVQLFILTGVTMVIYSLLYSLGRLYILSLGYQSIIIFFVSPSLFVF